MIELRHVYKEYTGRKHRKTLALSDVNLTLGDSGLVCLVGASGCGKTTILNIIGTLDAPSSGELYADGKNIGKMSGKELNEYRAVGVGFIFQELNLIEGLTVWDNLRLVCNKEDIEGKHAELLHKLEIDEFADKLPKELSGGQRQRVAIARAIVKGSKVLLCDEPTGSLDPENAVMTFELLKEISKERLVVVVSHDVDTVSKYADRIVRLEKGKIIEDTQNVAAQVETHDTPVQEKTEPEKTVPVAAAQGAARPKAGQRARALFGLSAHYLKYKRGRFAIMAVISMLLFLLLSLICSMTTFSRNTMVARTMKENDIHYITVSQTFHATERTWKEEWDHICKEIPFGEEALQNLSERLHCRVDPVYGFHAKRYDAGRGDSIAYGNLGEDKDQYNPYLSTRYARGFVRISPELLTAYGYSLIGALPQKETEVALGGYGLHAYELYGYQDGDKLISIVGAQDMVGRKIEIDGEMLTVTGVVDTHFDAKRYDPTLPERTRKQQTALNARENEFDCVREGVSMHNLLYVSDAYLDERIADYRPKTEDVSLYNIVLTAKKEDVATADDVSEKAALLRDISSADTVYYAPGFDTNSNAFFLRLDTVFDNDTISAFDEQARSDITAYIDKDWGRLEPIFSSAEIDIRYKEQGKAGYFDYIYNFGYGRTENVVDAGKTYRYFYTPIVQRAVETYAASHSPLRVRIAGSGATFDTSVPFGGVFETDYQSSQVGYQNQPLDAVLQQYVVFQQSYALEYDTPVMFGLLPAKGYKSAKHLLKHANKMYALASSDPTEMSEYSVLKADGVYYEMDNEAMRSVNKVDRTFSTIAKILRYVLIGMSLLTVLIILLYFAALLSSREKDVGVLRTNGYTKGEVALLFIFEALIVSAVFIALSILVSGILTPIVNAIVKKQFGMLCTVLYYTMRQVGLIVGFQLLFSAVGILIPLLLLLRKKPMEIINAGK